MLEPERIWFAIGKQAEENKQARRILEQAISAEQAEISKAKTREIRLLDLYESGDITKDVYRSRLAEIKAEIDKHDAEKRRLAERLGEYAVLTLEQQTTLQHFQHEFASRMTDDVPTAERMQLYDLLRVQCIYNSEMDELLISGLFGEATVHEIDKQSRIR